MNKRIIKILILLLLFSAAPVFIFTGCSDDQETAAGRIYYCPMHPEVQSDKPGVCPICHMDLVLKDHDGDDMTEHMDDEISLNSRKLALAGVSTTVVRSSQLSKDITAYSYLDFAEQNRRIITAKFNGRIEKLFVDRTGEYIKKGQQLFDIYSPDIIQAQNDYLIASSSFRNISDNGGESSIINAARQKLLLMGVTEKQIEELEQSGKVKMTMTYYSPSNGTVIDKKVQEGMYVNEGSVIYDVADLSELWSISEILSDDLGLVKEGSSVKMRLQAYPDREFTGRVDLIYPVVNAETRTVKIRSVFPNRNNLLKPNMYGETIFSVSSGKGLTIPSEAIIFTGKRSIVWVQTEPGKFRMREIKTGYRIGNNYQVISGLKEGEIIASEGTYLIDSESQLRSGTAVEGHQQHGESTSNEEQSSTNQSSHKEEPLMDKSSDVNKAMKVFNEVCPVLGNKVPADPVTVEYNGKTIGFCCPGCDQEFLSDPDKFMKNLSSDGKIFINNLN
jgi:membrane fusion protein, copper/silver efflux system